MQTEEVRSAARLICLIRVLMLAMAVGVFAIVGLYRDSSYFGYGADYVLVLLVAVMVVAVSLVLAVPWMVTARQLLLHLVFDLLWCGGVIYLSGGVLGPGIPLIFAVVLTANLALPRVLPFVLPALASVVLSVVALLYVGGLVPFSEDVLHSNARLVETSAIVGSLLIQVLGLFVVDFLGQFLAVRLHEQRLLVGDLLDQLGDGVIAIDRRGQPIHVNDEALRLFALPARAAEDPLRHLQADPVLSAFADLLRSSRTSVRAGSGPGGTWLRVRVGDLHGRRGRGIGRVLTVADETGLHRAEENARRFEHLASLGEMAAGIAHEIRNPLASLRGCAQELVEIHQEQQQPDAGGLSRIIVDEADRLARIVEDFLRLSRREGAQTVRIEPSELLETVCALIRHGELRTSGLRLRHAVAADCPAIAADSDHVRQILINLLSNALDAIQDVPVPEVLVEAAASSERVEGVAAVEISVLDNGPGIDPAIADEIFTPFVSGTAQGTGLGLAVVQRLVRLNNGQVEIRPRADGGTVVRVLLPAWGTD